MDFATATELDPAEITALLAGTRTRNEHPATLRTFLEREVKGIDVTDNYPGKKLASVYAGLNAARKANLDEFKAIKIILKDGKRLVLVNLPLMQA